MKMCPTCVSPLVAADRQGIEIDHCPRCRGVWLDRGELEKIVERTTRHFAGHERDEEDSDMSDDRRKFGVPPVHAGYPPPQPGYPPAGGYPPHPGYPPPGQYPPHPGYPPPGGYAPQGQYPPQKKKKKGFFDELFDFD